MTCFGSWAIWQLLGGPGKKEMETIDTRKTNRRQKGNTANDKENHKEAMDTKENRKGKPKRTNEQTGGTGICNGDFESNTNGWLHLHKTLYM